MSARVLPFKRPEPRQSLMCWDYDATATAMRRKRDHALEVLGWDRHWDAPSFHPAVADCHADETLHDVIAEIDSALELLAWLIGYTVRRQVQGDDVAWAVRAENVYRNGAMILSRARAWANVVLKRRQARPADVIALPWVTLPDPDAYDRVGRCRGCGRVYQRRGFLARHEAKCAEVITNIAAGTSKTSKSQAGRVITGDQTEGT